MEKIDTAAFCMPQKTKLDNLVLEQHQAVRQMVSPAGEIEEFRFYPADFLEWLFHAVYPNGTIRTELFQSILGPAVSAVVNDGDKDVGNGIAAVEIAGGVQLNTALKAAQTNATVIALRRAGFIFPISNQEDPDAKAVSEEKKASAANPAKNPGLAKYLPPEPPKQEQTPVQQATTPEPAPEPAAPVIEAPKAETTEQVDAAQADPGPLPGQANLFEIDNMDENPCVIVIADEEAPEEMSYEEALKVPVSLLPSATFGDLLKQPKAKEMLEFILRSGGTSESAKQERRAANAILAHEAMSKPVPPLE